MPLLSDQWQWTIYLAGPAPTSKEERLAMIQVFTRVPEGDPARREIVENKYIFFYIPRLLPK
jgi:hypothetical protein